MATIPANSEAEIAFISGAKADLTVTGLSYGAWDGNSPTTYGIGTENNQSSSFKWGSSTLGTFGGNVKYWFDGASMWTTVEQNGFLAGLHLWSAMADIIFNAAPDQASANIVFTRATDGTASAGFATVGTGTIGSTVTGTPFKTDGTMYSQMIVAIDTSVADFGPIGDPSIAASFQAGEGYVYNTIVHEAGHALGLGHGGAYNNGDGLGSVQARQFSQYDSRLWTIMSYIDPEDTTAAQFANYPVTGTDWGVPITPGSDAEYTVFGTTPMILDILAIQRIYGAATSGPLTGGNKVFGFNSNISGDVGNFFNFAVNTDPVVTIWCTGANNTLDLSGFNTDSTINLTPGQFSSADGRVNNIAIAMDVIIEHAVGGGGNDRIKGNGFVNNLQGRDGYDILEGFDGADVLDQGNGGGEMYGGNGFDTLIAGSGADYIDGGNDFDSVDYSRSTDAIQIDTTIGKVVGGWATGDTLVSIEQIVGTDFDDSIAMGSDANTIYGGSGADKLDGGDGSDTILGEAGNDILRGGLGADVVGGGSDFDIATFGSAVTINLQTGNHTGEAAGDFFVSIEQYNGSADSDTMVASNFQGARFAGVDGIDFLYGGDQGDWLQGGKGADYVNGGAGSDTVSYADMPYGITVEMYFVVGAPFGDTDGKITAGEWGLDTLVSIENVEGTGFNDFMIGDERSNTFWGLGGDDYMQGDQDTGSQGSADTLIGGAGNDRILIGAFDSAYGGLDSDTATFVGGPINLNFNTNTFTIGGQGFFLAEFETYVGTGGIDAVFGASYGETIILGEGNDFLYGQGGDDFLYIGAGADTMDGGDGYDTMVFHKAMVADWQAGVLDVDISSDPWYNWEAIQGSSGNDVIRTNSWGFSVELRGGAGNDVLATGVTGVVSDILSGEAGDDELNGGAGADTLSGGLDNDTLIGGEGDDTLTGGLGADTIVFRTGDGTDTIIDFNIAEGDKLDLTGVAGIHSLSDLTITQVGADTIITLGSGLVLKNFANGTLTASQFLFNQGTTDIALSNASVAENSAADTVIGGLSASGPNAGEIFTFSLLDDAGGRFATNGANVVVAGALDYESFASHDMTVRGTGSLGTVFDKTFTVGVTNVNEAPTANPDAGSAGENQTKLFDVLANDTDPDTGDTKTLVSIGTVTVSSGNPSVNGVNATSAFSIVGGQFLFSPGALFDPLASGDAASVVVDYTMRDAAGITSSSALTLAVNGAAEQPIVNTPFSFDLVSHPINSLTVGGSFAEVVSFTPDGRFGLFRTASSSLVPGDINGTTDFFLYDTQDKSVRLVTHTAASLTTTSNGELFDPNQGLFNPDLLPGNRYLFFRTTATNMAATDVNGIQDFFVYDIQDGSLDLVSHTAASLTTTADGFGVGLSTYQRTSSDGRYILLDSTATNMTATDVNGTATDLYVYDTLDQSLDLVSHAAGSLTTTTTELISGGLLAADGGHVLYRSSFPGDASNLPVTSALLYDVNDHSIARLGSTNSSPVTFSPDGRYVLYTSTEFQAGTTDPNGPDFRIYDTLDGSDELVNHTFGSLTQAGNQLATTGLVGTINQAFSPDSRYVVFASGATDIAGVDNNNTSDLFLYDVTDRSVDLMSHAFGLSTTTSLAGPFGSGTGAQSTFFSPSSRYFVFSSGSTNIAESDTNGVPDYFVYDTQDGSLDPLARAFGTAATTASGNFFSLGENFWSPDSRYLYFVHSAGNLAAPGVDTNNQADSFVYDSLDGSIDLVSHSVGPLTTAVGAIGAVFPVSGSPFSADSRYLLLETPAGNVAGTDANFGNDIFLYDTVDGSLDLVSHAAGSATTTANLGSSQASFSPDGRFVVFVSSATNIAGTDTNGNASDVFLYEIATGTVSLVSQRADGATANAASSLPVFSPDGTRLMFRSEATNLNDVVATDAAATPDLFLTSLPAPPVAGSVSIDDISITEGDTGFKTVTLTVTRTGGAAAFDVISALAGDTATGADFGPVPATLLSFAAGETTKTISVNIIGDTTAEPDETILVMLSNATNGANINKAQGQITITNDDVTSVSGSVAISDVTISEGDAGTKLATFTLTRIGGTAAFDVTYSTANGSATAGSDYVAAAGTASFAAGVSTAEVSVTINGDTAFEPDETVIVSLSGATNGAIITKAQGQITITNDDVAPVAGSVAISNVTISEGNAGTKLATFTLTRTGGTAAFDVTYSTANGSATAGSDYVAAAGTASFAAGVSTAEVSVTINGDTAFEPDETFLVNLSSPTNGATISDAQAQGTITNDDAELAVLAISPVFPAVLSKNEGTAGEVTSFSFTVTRTGDPSAAVTVDYDVNGSAVRFSPADGADFVDGVIVNGVPSITPVVPGGTLSWAAGDTSSRTITINVEGDTQLEPTEEFFVVLLNPTGGAIVSSSGSVAFGNIVDDDTNPPPSTLTLAPTSVSVLEGDSGLTAITYTITRTGDLSVSATVDYEVRDLPIPLAVTVTAADFANGVMPSGTIIFPANDPTPKSITVFVAGDTVLEQTELYGFVLSNPTGGATVDTGFSQGQITDDDGRLSITATDATKAEGNSGTTSFTFTVTRTGDVSFLPATTVDYTVSGNVNAADFGGVLPSGTITFAPNQTSRVITLNVSGDVDFESDKSFTVALSNSSNVPIEVVSATGTITNDDVEPAGSVAISNVTISEGNAGTKLATFTLTRIGGTAAFDVTYSTANGSATAGSDYVAAAGTASFAAGVNTAEVSVTINGDTAFEPDETFVVNLSGATNGATIGDAQAQGTITNDDNAGSTIVGQPGQTTVNGTAGPDNIVIGATNVFVNAGTGNDTITVTPNPGFQAHLLNGGAGSDTLDLSQLSTPASVNLVTGIATGSQIGLSFLTSIENVIGGSGSDSITASNVLNVLTGGSGADAFNFATLNAARNGNTFNASARDVITDFTETAAVAVGAPHDTINFAGIDAIQGGGNNAFVFNTTAWDGVGAEFTAAGQLRFQYVTDANGIEHTIVAGNVHTAAQGNGLAADFEIDLLGRHVLSASDFIL